ncbi:MAG: VWA domain-containing protein [Deltaproteobacteria bacterium]|nr:VWA domain-containing protein [Deltaproteobacteria bacterium]
MNRQSILKIPALFIISIFLLSGCDGAFMDYDSSPIDTEKDSSKTKTSKETIASVDTADSSGQLAPDSQTANNTDSDTASIETETDTVLYTPGPRRFLTEECIAPNRDEYMAGFGVTMENRDLTDPNVIAAKEQTILFIFDKSGSMGDAWNDDGGSKWEIARNTMIQAVTPYQEYTSAGAIFFSLDDGIDDVSRIDAGKQINYTDAPTFLDIWDENMGMYGAGGGTPLMDALTIADDAIGLACEMGLLNKPFEVVLLTDGMPDYWNQSEALGLIEEWYSHGIPTTVIGMPGSDSASQILSDIAAVGSGGELQEDGQTTAGSAEEITYTSDSSTETFESGMQLIVE